MSRLLLLLALLVAGSAQAADYAPGSPLTTFEGPRADYAFRCKGCHGFAGQGTPGHVPRLDGFVGFFTQVPDGRDYLMRVPGVARAKLDDVRLAAVLNWMLATYGGNSVAAGFVPYTADEVGRVRKQVLTGRKPVRDRLLDEMRARGLISDGEDGLGRSPERRG